MILLTQLSKMLNAIWMWLGYIGNKLTDWGLKNKHNEQQTKQFYGLMKNIQQQANEILLG